MSSDLKQNLINEVLKARTRVYNLGASTPLEPLSIPDINASLWVKREDLSPIHAYKWRGAYNATASMMDEIPLESKAGNTIVIVAASAGNHAQGIALTARKMGIKAVIFMPQSTPMMKQNAVKLHGQDNVEIRLVGDTYDQASAAAKEFSAENNYTYIHPFDDIRTIAGQATIADEIILSGNGAFDFIFVPIGGGGMAAGVANWIKLHHPNTKVIGVEGVDQASMKAALQHGAPVTLETIDGFCDGTAVKRVGDTTFALCKDVLDDIVTVTNEEVCAAIQTYWDTLRVVPEPSGAMALAAFMKLYRTEKSLLEGKKSVVICCGANMDFGKLATISSQSAVGAHRRRYVRLHINEEAGSLLSLLETYFADVNVSEFQYGKMDHKNGYPVIAFEASEELIDAKLKSLNQNGIECQDVTSDADVRYRIINYNPSLFNDPLFMSVHFPERRGALRDFMRLISDVSNVVYFNYAYSGEQIGRAIMGFEFKTPKDREDFIDKVQSFTIVTTKPLPDDVQKRLTTYVSDIQNMDKGVVAA